MRARRSPCSSLSWATKVAQFVNSLHGAKQPTSGAERSPWKKAQAMPPPKECKEAISYISQVKLSHLVCITSLISCFVTDVHASLSNNLPASGKDTSRAQAITLTASPNLSSRLDICYRTLPFSPSDRRFRPDLRLAASDPSVRKVSGVVTWLEKAVGLNRT